MNGCPKQYPSCKSLVSTKNGLLHSQCVGEVGAGIKYAYVSFAADGVGKPFDGKLILQDGSQTRERSRISILLIPILNLTGSFFRNL